MTTKILVADDSATMRRVLEMTFAGEDAEVRVVSSGDEAIDVAAQFGPDLVLADASMESPDGYQLSHTLKRSAETSQPAVILLSSTHAPYDEVRGRNCGVDDHISKPFDTQDLIDKTSTVLQSPRKLPSDLLPAQTAATDVEAPVAQALDAESQSSTGTLPPNAVETPEVSVSAQPQGAGAGQATPTQPARPHPQDPNVEVTGDPGNGAVPAEEVLPRVSPSELAASAGESSESAGSPPLSEDAAQMLQAALVDGASGGEGTSEDDDATPLADATLLKNAGLPSLGEASGPADEGAPFPSQPDAASEPATNGDALGGLESKLQGLGLTSDQVVGVLALSREVIEQVVWEVVPDLAETLIREEIQRLTTDDTKD